MSSPIAPRVSPLGEKCTQLSYRISHSRVHCCQPFSAASASAHDVVVYGHDSGITVLYRYREPPDAGPAPSNGAPIPARSESPYAFVASHTVHLGTPVYVIAFPHPSLTRDLDVQNAGRPSGARALLASSITFAVACRDRTIRLVSLPSNPPSESSKFRAGVLTLGGGASTHQTPATDLSLTVLPSQDDDHPSRGDITIASISADGSGVIIIWRIPVANPSRPNRLPAFPTSASKPTILHLFSPPISAAFNNSPTSLSRQHQILVTEDAGAVRIRDVRSERWLASFHAPFSRVTSRRKRILSADWCISGRGIIVLLEDGEYGIWDLESSLCSSEETTAGFIIGGVVGEDWTGLTSAKRRMKRAIGSNAADEDDMRSSLTGSTAEVSSLAYATTAASSRWAQNREFHTRERTPGSVAVYQIPGTQLVPSVSFMQADDSSPSSKPSSYLEDEAFAILYGDTLVYVPSLRKLWKIEGKKRKRHAGTGGEDEMVVIRGVGGGIDPKSIGKIGFLGIKKVVAALGPKIGVLQIKMED